MSKTEAGKLVTALGIDSMTADLDAIRVAYIGKIRAIAAGHRSHNGVDLVEARAKNEMLDGELKELTLAEKRGQLVNLAQLEPELGQMVVAFRTDLLSRDDKLKAELDTMYGIDVDLNLLNLHTHEALLQLARYDPDANAKQQASAQAMPNE